MKEEFKAFVKNNPKLISYVKNNEMTWQKFYEMFDLYGSDNEIWNTYLDRNITKKITKTGLSGLTLSEVVNYIKGVDLNSLEEGIGNVQRVLGVVKDFTNKNETSVKSEYKPRPLYKHFED